MKVEDIMTDDPSCCTPDTTLLKVAKMMSDMDCGEIPVVDNQISLKPVGVITDRDIVCRAVAEGKNPLDMTVRECMSSPCIAVTPDTSLEECCGILEKNQIRRVPVVDEQGSCCGIVAQADIARKASEEQVAEVVKEVSRI
ncbi:MAG: CBS domain-containing protein [Candidatus Omnitrophica bacterium]|nr:CBS domain-containing protein [Candidatus Omnitrophota bacterium]